MTITTNANSLKSVLNQANPGTLADALRSLGFGSLLRAMPVPLRAVLPSAAAVNPYVAAAAQSIILPDDAKASFLFRAYGRTGTATAVAMTLDAADSTGAAPNPAANHCAISASGDLVFHGADAWTLVDVLYLPEKYDMLELTLPVVSNTLTLPTGLGPAVFLAEAESLVGSVVAKMIVDFPGTAVATGHAALNLAKATVAFQATDAVTSARVKVGFASSLDANALLEAVSSLI